MQLFDHFIFIFYIYILIFSTVGYGLIFSKLFYRDFIATNIGYLGLIGFFSLSFYSIASSFIFAHNYSHNLIIHLIGILGFLYSLKKEYLKISDVKNLIVFTLILFLGTYVFKNHDDFPYYHLTYTLNLSQNSFIIGTGIFSHGFRTFSSLFYYHSLLYLPYIKYYLFYIGPFFILIYFNLIVYYRLIKEYEFQEEQFLNYFSILALLFVNIVFYRIGEHGTDRSAQIILLLIFILFFELIYFKLTEENFTKKINLFLLLLFLSASMKALYYIYFLILPAILIKKRYFKKYFVSKNYFLICIFTLSFFLNVVTNFFNTGCFLYPAKITCVENVKWNIPIKEVEKMKIHYEWWAKAGGGPGYKSDIPKEEYIKNFKWVGNWIDRHFFNKVSDTFYGILAISLIFFIVITKQSSGTKKILIKKYFAFVYPLIFLFEWFINHPAMRYGGYVLFALPIFIFVSTALNKYVLEDKIIKKIFISFIIVSILIFNIRNIVRIDKEMKVYNYDLLKSPFYFTKKVDSEIILNSEKFKVYTTKENVMCWAANTPCSYHKKIKRDKFLWMNVVLRDLRE